MEDRIGKGVTGFMLCFCLLSHTQIQLIQITHNTTTFQESPAAENAPVCTYMQSTTEHFHRRHLRIYILLAQSISCWSTQSELGQQITRSVAKCYIAYPYKECPPWFTVVYHHKVSIQIWCCHFLSMFRKYLNWSIILKFSKEAKELSGRQMTHILQGGTKVWYKVKFSMNSEDLPIVKYSGA